MISETEMISLTDVIRLEFICESWIILTTNYKSVLDVNQSHHNKPSVSERNLIRPFFLFSVEPVGPDLEAGGAEALPPPRTEDQLPQGHKVHQQHNQRKL